MSFSEGEKDSYYIVFVDNKDGSLSDAFNWIDEDGAQTLLGTSMRIVSENEFESLGISKYTDGALGMGNRYIRVKRMDPGRNSRCPTKAQAAFLLGKCKEMGAYEAVGNCDVDLLQCVADATDVNNGSEFNAVRSCRNGGLEKDDEEEEGEITSMFAVDELPPSQSPHLKKSSVPISAFLVHQ